jgi:hypothetical protein
MYKQISVSVVYNQRRTIINTIIYKKGKCYIYIYILIYVYTRPKRVAVSVENIVGFDGTVKDLLLNVPQHKGMYSTKIRLCSVVTTFMFRHY